MTIQALKALYIRDLARLKREINLYENDETLWRVERSIKNSGGNLCLHLIGNLKTYIGNGLADLDYARQRDVEFSGKGIDRMELFQQIDETIEAVKRGLDHLSEEQWNDDFPVVVWEKPTSMAFTLFHLYGHLNYHLGQINYHRRLLERT